MNTPMIHSALQHSGRITIQCVIPHRRIFQATLEQPGEPSVSSGISLSIEGVLESLEAKLKADFESQQEESA